MLNWVVVQEKYLDFLRENGDRRIPHSNYGKDKLKPFFGVLFTIGKYAYVTQISHPKDRHQTMTEAADFKKIYDEKRLLGVVNLNYMFPVPVSQIEYLQYSKIEEHRSFKNGIEKSKYINLLKTEMRIINTRDISSAAKKVYDQKYLFPESNLAKRCLDFRYLEKIADTFE